MDERLNHLLKLKQTVNQYPCKVASDIAELVDREADLLHQGYGIDSLEGLRGRINGLTFFFIEEYYNEMKQHCPL